MLILFIIINSNYLSIYSLWAEFVNKDRCICVFLVSEEGKIALHFDNFDNSHNSFI